MLSLILARMGKSRASRVLQRGRLPSKQVESGLQKANREVKATIPTQRLLTVFGIVLLFIGLLPSAHSQTKNEVGLVIGATTTPSQTLSQGSDLSFNASLALGAEYDRRLATAKRLAIYGGVDYLASPLDVKLSQPPPGVSPQYAYEFLTPHVRVKLNPAGPIAPWFSFGGGYARFLEKAPNGGTSFRPGTNTGTFEFGAGIDTRSVVRLLRIPIGFRFEVRDFYSGLPNYNRPIDASRQNNVAFTGGLLIRF
jgi:hypothetical protein